MGFVAVWGWRRANAPVSERSEALVRRAGVRPIRLHDLRHSCATLLFAQHVEAATVQRILRHSSISVTTGTYLKVIDPVQREAVASMDKLFRGPGLSSNDVVS